MLAHDNNFTEVPVIILLLETNFGYGAWDINNITKLIIGNSITFLI